MADFILDENELPSTSKNYIENLRKVFRTQELPNNSQKALLIHPTLGELWMDIGLKLSTAGKIPAALREILILRTAYFYNSDYELHYHLQFAKREAVSETVLDLLQKKATSEFFPRELQDYIKLCDQFNNREIFDYEAISHREGKEVLMEILMLIGFYSFVAQYMHGLQIPLP